MSCPNWSQLVDCREDDDHAWDEALAHFDECAQCRDGAIAAEPSLLFRGMGSPEIDFFGADDIAAIKSGVATMRRAEPYQQQEKSRWQASSSLRAAALASLLLSAGFLQGASSSESWAPHLAADSSQADVVAWAPAMGSGHEPEASGSLFFDGRSLEQIPLVEDVDPAYGSIIQVIDQDISLLVVVPTSLDV